MTAVPTRAKHASAVHIWAALGVVYVLWGSTYLAIKFAIETLPPLLHASFRFSLAGLIALVAVRIVRGRAALRATRSQLLTAAVSGLLLLLGGNGLVTIGEQKVDTGVAALIVACVPLWIILLRVLQRDLPGPVTLAGVLFGLVGVSILFLPGGGSGQVDPLYAGMIVLATLSWAIGSYITARSPTPPDPFFLTALQMLVAGVALAVVALARGEGGDFVPADVSTGSWVALAYLVVFGSLFAFTAYVWLLGVAPVSVVSTYAYVNPAVAVVLGVLLNDEHLSSTEILGGLVILVAVAVVVTEEGRRQRRVRLAAAAVAEPVCAVPGRAN